MILTVDVRCITNSNRGILIIPVLVFSIFRYNYSKKFIRRSVRENVENPSTEISEGLYRVELAFKGSISAGSQFDPNVIKKMKGRILIV